MPEVVIAGLTMGFGASLYCLASCVPVLVPLTIAHKNPSILSGLNSALLFSLGRLVAYSSLLIVFSILKELVPISYIVVAIATLLSGLLLAMSGLVELGAFALPNTMGRVICKYVSSSRSPFYLGALTSIQPCGPLLAALAFMLTLSSIINMGVFLLFFWLASSIILLGVGISGGSLASLLGRGIGLMRLRRITSIALAVIGSLMIFQGFTQIFFYQTV